MSHAVGPVVVKGAGVVVLQKRCNRGDVSKPPSRIYKKKNNFQISYSRKWLQISFPGTKINPEQGCHLSSTSKFRLFPDFSLTFRSFPYPLTEIKKKIIFILYFNGANCITSNWGLLLKERICSLREQIFSFKSSPNEEGDGLRLSHEKVHLFPLEQYK